MKEHHKDFVHDGKSHNGKGHIKHAPHPHDKIAAAQQFKKGHFEMEPGEVEYAGGRYASEMNTNHEYKKGVDDLARYVKSHHAEH